MFPSRYLHLLLKPCQLRMLILFLRKSNSNLNLFIAISFWSEWSDCSLTCDFGQKTRTRICQQNCDGVSIDDLSETKSCYEELLCPGEQIAMNMIISKSNSFLPKKYDIIPR